MKTIERAILVSIQPYWVFLIIANIMGWNIGKEKTIEVRKNYPKEERWNKVAKIYCSKSKKSFNQIPKEYQPLMKKFLGKVVGEFVCDAIISHCEMENADIAEQQGYIKREWLLEYAGDKELFGWHISDIAIYEKPKELSEFRKPCDYDLGCKCCSMYFPGTMFAEPYCKNGSLEIKRPPQSWCYVGTL